MSDPTNNPTVEETLERIKKITENSQTIPDTGKSFEVKDGAAVGFITTDALGNEVIPPPPIIGPKVVTLSRKEQITQELIQIEMDHKGFSNIPMNSNYWELKKELSQLS